MRHRWAFLQETPAVSPPPSPVCSPLVCLPLPLPTPVCTTQRCSQPPNAWHAGRNRCLKPLCQHIQCPPPQHAGVAGSVLSFAALSGPGDCPSDLRCSGVLRPSRCFPPSWTNAFLRRVDDSCRFTCCCSRGNSVIVLHTCEPNHAGV